MIYFLSDAHIGSLALSDVKEHERRVCALLKQMGQDATQIWLLGDMFDFWYEYIWHQTERYTVFLDTLRDLCAKGVEVHYMIGNHDIWTFGWLHKRTGVIVHKGVFDGEIGGKKCLLAHGDGLIASDQLKKYPKEIQTKIRRFMLLRKVFHNPLLQFMFRFVPPCVGDKIGYTWAKHSREKELRHPCGYKGEENEELVGYAKEQESKRHRDYYVFGHRHIELDLELGTKARVIILGDMFKQWTYGVMDEKGNFELRNYE